MYSVGQLRGPKIEGVKQMNPFSSTKNSANEQINSQSKYFVQIFSTECDHTHTHTHTQSYAPVSTSNKIKQLETPTFSSNIIWTHGIERQKRK